MVVLVSNPRKVVNIFLSLFLLSGFLWLLFNILTNFSYHNPSNALLFARLSLIGAALLPFFFLLFSLSFVEKKIKNKEVVIFAIPVIAIISTTFTNLNVKNADSKNFESGIIYPILIFVLIIYFSYSVYRLKSYHSSSSSYEKTQIQYFYYGIILTLTPSLLFNAILPAFKYGEYAAYGPASVIFLSLFMTFAIIKHKLLDIRTVAFRAAGYIFSIGTLVIFFAIASSLLTRYIYQSGVKGYIPIIVNIVIFVAAILSYPPIKRYFDKITNKIFFRDAYDPQEFLDQLNKAIVSNIEVGILLRRVTTVIQENMKSSFVEVGIPSEDGKKDRVIGTEDIEYTQHESRYMRGRLVGLGSKIITSEDLESTDEELQKIYLKYNIAALVHLSVTSYQQTQTIAYMIFGNKRSGNVYSKADIKIIEIIADELVIAIQNALRFEEIQEFNITLQDKVNNATTKLKRTNEKLKAMDATKDEFISMASHQLRTPLTSVKGYMSMVLDGDAGEINDAQRKLLEQSFVSSQRMVYLISDLLNVSRLKYGKFIIENKKCNLADMVEGEIAQLAEQASLKDIKINYDKPKDFIDLMLDENKVRQVIMNFTDNALYYTPRGGRIEVELRDDKTNVYFMVKDNGIGVPDDEKKHMFTKFYRARNAREARPDGTGLGLFMAKKVVETQGGNILFDSKENKGSTFGFSFDKKSHAVEIK